MTLLCTICSKALAAEVLIAALLVVGVLIGAPFPSEEIIVATAD